jgi:predicted unusual protein kinase regulating ubiquinone biosynthesis (AarF/ABC1/UbiB family)
MNKMPTGKVGRALAGGHTAAKVGGKMLTYYAKRPFLSREAQKRAKEEASQAGAQMLFSGLSLLKGTALKMAQQLSLEMDMLPEAACKELAKAYHQVPPINKALVRKVVQDGLGQPPEEIFREFDLTAFAAASLGQVHRAVDGDDHVLAVKVQYPGIAKTIDNDVALLRQMLRPLIQSEHLLPTLAEVVDRLREEVDYLQEAKNLHYFADHLNVEGVRIPEVRTDMTAGTVLTTTLMPGKTLGVWLAGNPKKEAKEIVVQRLNKILLKGLYELNVFHADPNPGNFIIADDLTIGLVDFGCVKRLEPKFIEAYRQLVLSAAHHDTEAHLKNMINLGMVSANLENEKLEEIKEISNVIGEWFGALYAEEQFDFSAHPGFIADGKLVMQRFHNLRRYVKINPDFLFLERTRYGLLRLFEQMGVLVRFRNDFEW